MRERKVEVIIIESIFEDNGYEDIKKTGELIKSFCDGNSNWLEGLKHIYLHKNHGEMFIVFDMIGKEKPNILKRIKEIEECVLTYINFEWEEVKKYKYIKYNITLIIRCNSVDLGGNNIIIKEEKSTTICRKIFLFDDKNEEEELNYLPFYFSKLKKVQTSKLETIYKRLNLKFEEATVFLKKIEEGDN